MPNYASALVTRTKDSWNRVPASGNDYLPRSTSGYNITRGILLPYFNGGSPQDIERLINQGVIFQFNPEKISYSKENRFGEFNRLGYSAQINFWNSGGPFSISFDLMMDYTPGSLYKSFRHPNGTFNNYNKTNGEYINVDDYTNSGLGDQELGLLPEIEKLLAFQYPKQGNNELVTFVNNMPDFRGERQFFQPPYVLFNYGNVVAKCFVQSLSRSDVLFNTKLNPIRTEFSITLLVVENEIVNTNLVLRPAQEKITNFKNDWV